MKKPAGFYYLNYLNKIDKVYLYVIMLLSLSYGNISLSEKYVDQGITHLYNYQFQESIAALDSALLIDPQHPLPPFLLIVNEWLYQQTEFGYDASYQAINDGIKISIPVYENLIRENPENAEYVLFLGCTYGIKARIGLARKDWLDVLYAGYKGLNLVKKSYEMDPELFDALMPIGLLDYYACISSLPVQWLSRIMGITPDCELGISELEDAVKKSKYAWIESANVLTYIYLYFQKDYEQALRVVTPLADHFPGHPFFQFLKAESLGHLGRWNEVEEMRESLEFLTKNGPFLQRNECELKLNHLDALYHFQHGNFIKVIEITTWMIENYYMEFDWLLGFAHLLRGKSYDIQGDRKSAISDYKIMLSVENHFPQVQEAEALIKAPYIWNEK